MRLVDCYIPVLALVRQFVSQPQGEAPALAARLQPLLAAAQQDATALGSSDEEIRAALFAVAAWVDEAVLTCDWAGAGDWQRCLLQRQIFDVSNAGVAFFERLAALGAGHAAVQEVFVLCLSMGFKGRYGHGGDARELAGIRLRSMRNVLSHASAGGQADVASLVFPGAEGGVEPEAAARSRRPRWLPSGESLLFMAVPLLVLAVLYAIFFLLIRQQVHAVLPLIR